MDTDEELEKFKQILIAGILFLVSAYFSYQEVRYLIWSEVTTAKVTSAEFDTVRMRRGRRKEVKRIQYSFTDEEGKTISGEENFPVDSPVESGDDIQVKYIPGVEDSTKMKGSVNYLAILFFVGSLLFLGYSLRKLIAEANEPFKPR